MATSSGPSGLPLAPSEQTEAETSSPGRLREQQPAVNVTPCVPWTRLGGFPLQPRGVTAHHSGTITGRGESVGRGTRVTSLTAAHISKPHL